MRFVMLANTLLVTVVQITNGYDNYNNNNNTQCNYCIQL